MSKPYLYPIWDFHTLNASSFFSASSLSKVINTLGVNDGLTLFKTSYPNIDDVSLNIVNTHSGITLWSWWKSCGVGQNTISQSTLLRIL